MNPPIPLVAGRFRSGEYEGIGFFEEIAPLFGRRFVGLEGLGDCPAGLFPNVSNPGFCTNVPPAQQGRPVDPGIVAPAPATISDPINASIVAANSATRFGLQLTPDRATQEQLAAEVIAQAARRGLTASCRIAVNTAPAMLGIPDYLGYAAYCIVGGGGEDSAAQLLLPGHLDVYAINNPGAIPAAVSTAAPGGPPAGTVAVPGVAPSVPPSSSSTSTGAPIPVSAGSGFNFDPSGLLSDAQGFVSPIADQLGVPSWAVLAAAAAAAFYFVRGKH